MSTFFRNANVITEPVVGHRGCEVARAEMDKARFQPGWSGYQTGAVSLGYYDREVYTPLASSGKTENGRLPLDILARLATESTPVVTSSWHDLYYNLLIVQNVVPTVGRYLLPWGFVSGVRNTILVLDGTHILGCREFVGIARHGESDANTTMLKMAIVSMAEVWACQLSYDYEKNRTH